MATGRRIRVLVVDDSAVMRQIFSAILSSQRDMDVVVAADPLIAMSKMAAARPDVIVLDVEMPRMDGLTFLRRIMSTDPIPVVVCSGFAGAGTEIALRALEQGAVDVVAKPQLGLRDFLQDSARELLLVVRSAAEARVQREPSVPSPAAPPLAVMLPERGPPPTPGAIIAIGASTGGTEALRALLANLPQHTPPLLIVQHMHRAFTAAFAERLNRSCALEVREASGRDVLRPGLALVAPGNRHLRLTRRRAEYAVELDDGPPVAHHRPSVDVLFRSVAQAAGKNAIGVLLTGMGADGAAGLLELRLAGGRTLVEDESSCVVFGMPREAIRLGAAEQVVPLADMSSAILRAVEKLSRSGAELALPRA